MAEGGRAALCSKLELNLVEDDVRIGHGGISSNTIVVQGFSAGTSEELLGMYFENARRSGGGDVKQVQIRNGIAYITFEEMEVAQRVISHSHHQVTGQPLTVTLFCPPPQKPCYENKILILGLNSAVTEELFINFLETERGMRVTEILYGEEEGKVVLTFSENIDFNALRKACKERRVEEMLLQVEKVTVSNCIIVDKLQPSASNDTVLLYFENKRSGGGACERVEMKAEERYCLVYFEDHNVIDRVLNQKHKIDGANVEVHLHHKCLGKRSSRSRLKPYPESATLEAGIEEFEDQETLYTVTKGDSSTVSSNPDKESDFIEVLDWQENDGRSCELLMLIKFRMACRNEVMRDIKKIPCSWNFLAYWNFYTKNKQGQHMLDEIVKKNGCRIAVCSDDEYLFLFEVIDTYFEQKSDVVHFIYAVLDNVYKCAQLHLHFDILLVDQNMQKDVIELVRQTKELDVAWIELMGEQDPDAVYVICSENDKIPVLQVVTKIMSDVKECFLNHEEVVSVDFKWQRVMTKFGYLQKLGNKYPHVTIIPDDKNDALVFKGPKDETKTAAVDFWELLGTANSEIQEDSFSPGCQFEIFTSPVMCDYIYNSIVVLPILWIPNHLTKKIHLFFKKSEQIKGVDKFIKGCVQEKLYPLSKDHCGLSMEKIRALEELKKKYTGKIVIDQYPMGLLVTTADDIFEYVDASILEIILKEIEPGQDLDVPKKPDERDAQPLTQAELIATSGNKGTKNLLFEKNSAHDKDITKATEVKSVQVANDPDKRDEQPVSKDEPVVTRLNHEDKRFLSLKVILPDKDIAEVIEESPINVEEDLSDKRDEQPSSHAEPVLTRVNQETSNFLSEKIRLHDMDIVTRIEVKSVNVLEKPDNRDGKPLTVVEPFVATVNQEASSLSIQKVIAHDKDFKKTTEVKSGQVVNDPDKRDEQPVSKDVSIVSSGNQETKCLLSQEVIAGDEEISKLIEFKSNHIEDQPDQRQIHTVSKAEPVVTSGNQETKVPVKSAKPVTVSSRKCKYCKKIGTFQCASCKLPYCSRDCLMNVLPRHQCCKQIKVLNTEGGLEKPFKDDHIGQSDDVPQGSQGKQVKVSRGGSVKQQEEKTLTLHADIELHHAEHPWKPSHLTDRSKLSEEELKSEELYKKVRGILNKLTPQKFQTLVSKMQVLKIDTETRLKNVIDLVFEKAISEPHFSVVYANMCRCLSMVW